MFMLVSDGLIASSVLRSIRILDHLHSNAAVVIVCTHDAIGLEVNAKRRYLYTSPSPKCITTDKGRIRFQIETSM